MRKINKIVSIALIFMLIGMFFCQSLYAIRVPIGLYETKRRANRAKGQVAFIERINKAKAELNIGEGEKVDVNTLAIKMGYENKGNFRVQARHLGLTAKELRAMDIEGIWFPRKTTGAKRRISFSEAWFKLKIHFDFYELLKDKKTPSEDDIKGVYRILSKRYHPDTHPGDKTAEEKMRILNQIKELLLKKKDLKTINKETLIYHVPGVLIRRLKECLDGDTEVRGKFYVYDSETGIRNITVSVNELADLVNADSELIPWGIEKLNRELKKEGLNPFYLPPEILLTDGNNILPKEIGTVLKSSGSNQKRI